MNPEGEFHNEVPIEQQIEEEINFAKWKAKAENQQERQGDTDEGWERHLLEAFPSYLPSLPGVRTLRDVITPTDETPIRDRIGDTVELSNKYLNGSIVSFYENIDSAVAEEGNSDEIHRLRLLINASISDYVESEPDLYLLLENRKDAQRKLDALLVPVYVNLRKKGYSRIDLTRG